MRKAGKPIGGLCIAPVVIARILGEVTVTIGHDVDTAAAITDMGAKHQAAGPGEVVVDRTARVATTPAYMLDSPISQIAQGADNLVAALLDLCRVASDEG
jgi:enhancing lycopene biosynthesis protein 2